MVFADGSDKQITKMQHYVPKAYLQFFEVNDNKNAGVYALFADQEYPKLVSIENICCAAYLYDQIAIVPPDGERVITSFNQIEKSYIDIEREYASILRKIKEQIYSRNEVSLLVEEIEKLKHFVSSLLFRNPRFVQISNAIVDKMFSNNMEFINSWKENDLDLPFSIGISGVANLFLKMSFSPNQGIFVKTLQSTMRDSQFCILRTRQQMLITSDEPVLNIYGEKNGIQYDLIGMPITPDLFLAFIDCDMTVPKVMFIDEGSAKRINRRLMSRGHKLLISNDGNLLLRADFEQDTNDNCVDVDDSWLREMFPEEDEEILKISKEILNWKRIKYWEAN